MEKNAPGPMRRVWSETDRLRYARERRLFVGK
jgi:hypothetical protein